MNTAHRCRDKVFQLVSFSEVDKYLNSNKQNKKMLSFKTRVILTFSVTIQEKIF